VRDRCVVGVRNGALGRSVFCRPLQGPSWTGRLLPLVTKKVVEEVVVPLGRLGCPCTLEPAADRVHTSAAAEATGPAEPLLFEARALGFRTAVLVGVGCTVGLSEGVSARYEGNRFFVVHGHASKRLANIHRRRERIAVGVRALRVYVDQTHLNSTKWLFQVSFAGVTLVVEPGALRTPVDVLFWFPDILASSREIECWETH